MRVLGASRWSLGCGLCLAGWSATAGCDPEVVNYGDGDGDATTDSTSDTDETERESGSGGSELGTGGETSGGAWGEATGGSMPLGGAGPTPFPWPELPEERGSAVGIEEGDVSATGCCSRIPGELEDAEYCPDVSESRAIVDFESQFQAKTVTFDSEPMARLQVSSIGPEAPVRAGFILTELVPPEGIIDLSPVYWVGMDGVDQPLSVGIMPMNYPVSTLDHEQSRVFYSEDGVEYEQLFALGVEVGGPTANLPGAGFFLAGAAPDAVQCDEPE